MKWQEVYKQKLTTAGKAVAHIQSGNRVVVEHACGSPETLIKAMVANKKAYRGVEIVHMVSMGASEYCLPENSRHFIHNSLFAGETTRKAINEGRAVFTPCFPYCDTVSCAGQAPPTKLAKDRKRIPRGAHSK